MTALLNNEEIAAETSVHDGEARSVTVTFTISAEAIDTLVKRGVTGRSLQQSQTVLLACGMYTMLAGLRDQQHSSPPMDAEALRKNVPEARRRAQLKRAGRCAALALTNLEDTLMWAAQAREHAD
jgi:hypothetical protein